VGRQPRYYHDKRWKSYSNTGVTTQCNSGLKFFFTVHCYAPTPRVGGIKRRCASDCLSVAYIGPKSENREALGRLKLARCSLRRTWLGHHFQGQKVNLQGTVAYCGGLPHSLLHTYCLKSLLEHMRHGFACELWTLFIRQKTISTFWPLLTLLLKIWSITALCLAIA